MRLLGAAMRNSVTVRPERRRLQSTRCTSSHAIVLRGKSQPPPPATPSSETTDWRGGHHLDEDGGGDQRGRENEGVDDEAQRQVNVLVPGLRGSRVATGISMGSIDSQRSSEWAEIRVVLTTPW